MRNSIGSSIKGLLGLPTSSGSRKHSRASSNHSTHSRASSKNEGVDAQDATPTSPALPSPVVSPPLATTPPIPPPTSPPVSAPAFPTQTMHSHHSSLEASTVDTSNATPTPQHFPPLSPSITPMPENEARAQASLGAQCALSFAVVMQELAPIPGIGPLAECLATVFQAVEKTRVNKEQWKLLQGRCVMVMRIAGARVMNNGGLGYPGLDDSAALLQKTITTIGQRATYWNEMQDFLAFFQFQSISEEIRGHFAQLDACLRMFSFAADIAQTQWISEFSAVQRVELHELGQVHKLLISLGVNMDLIGKTNDQLKMMISQMDEKLQKVLEDKSAILQRQETTTMDTYVDAQNIVKTILTVTKLQLPPQILLGRQCIPDTTVPIKTGVTCDVYLASFLGGERVVKKVFRIGLSEKKGVQKYAERFLRDAKLWATFRSDYTLPFYGIGMESFEGNDHFQLYMVSPLMKNFDAVTYLQEYRNNAGIKQNIMRIIMDAARGLQYLHTRDPPVVHSGMRGDNILITDSGGAVLGGFGLTKALQSSTGDENEKIPPAVMTGRTESQRWMAPELLEEDQPVLRTPSDIWGWAMAALELVSGNRPYFKHGQSHILMLQILIGKTPIRNNHADFDKYALQPDELWALFERCWAMSPSERPTIQEVITDLERIKAMPDIKSSTD